MTWHTQSLDQERRVFAVDMRNHGASSHHESMTYVNMANDVLGFLADKVGFRECCSVFLEGAAMRRTWVSRSPFFSM